SDPIPMTHERPASMDRKPTARTSAARSPHRERAAARDAAPGFMVATRKRAARVRGAFTACGRGLTFVPRFQCSSRMTKHEVRELLPMLARVAEKNLRRLLSLVIELQVMLPSEANTAVHLHAPVGHFARGIGHVDFGRRYVAGRVLRFGIQRPGGEVDCRARAFGPKQHVRT